MKPAGVQTFFWEEPEEEMGRMAMLDSGYNRQTQLNGLAANQAEKAQKSGMIYNKKSTVSALIVVLAVLLAVAAVIIFLSASRGPKAYVYYNGILYEDRNAETSYTNLVNEGGIKVGNLSVTDAKGKELSEEFTTNSENYDGGRLYAIPDDPSKIFIWAADSTFHVLYQVS